MFSLLALVRDILVGPAKPQPRPWIDAHNREQTVGDVDDLTAVARATGVLVDQQQPAEEPVDYLPTGYQPVVEFTAEPIHPSLRGELNDASLAGFVDYCWKTS